MINGILGAKKKPVNEANMIGINRLKPVMVDNRIMVLIGVRVTQAFNAAIQLTIIKALSIFGKKWFNNSPSTAPEKNNGIIKPPLQPEVTVIIIAIILTPRI